MKPNPGSTVLLTILTLATALLALSEPAHSQSADQKSTGSDDTKTRANIAGIWHSNTDLGVQRIKITQKGDQADATFQAGVVLPKKQHWKKGTLKIEGDRVSASLDHGKKLEGRVKKEPNQADTVEWNDGSTWAKITELKTINAVALAQTERGIVTSFFAEPETIKKGRSSLLKWTTEGGGKFYLLPIAGHPNGLAVEANGSYEVTPPRSTVYLLTGGAGGGDGERTVLVLVED